MSSPATAAPRSAHQPAWRLLGASLVALAAMVGATLGAAADASAVTYPVPHPHDADGADDGGVQPRPRRCPRPPRP